MELLAFFLTLTFVATIGMLLGFFFKAYFTTREKNSLEVKIKKLKENAESDAAIIVTKAQEKATLLMEKATKDMAEERDQIKESQKHLTQREHFLDERQIRIDHELQRITQTEEELQQEKKKLDQAIDRHIKELENITKLSAKEAREQLFEAVEKQAQKDLFSRIQKLEKQSSEELDHKAQAILTTAIHRLGNSVENDIMSVSVNLPSDDVKGKIIGKEGRNIKTFEKETGVQLIIDETPNQITISCFDPIRRAVAKMALEELIESGRIQPAKIEEIVIKNKEKVQQLIKEKGKDAAHQARVPGLSEELLELLGKLYFRYSYGQNVLQHSVEMAHIAGMISEEIAADAEVARAGALLHDIGKALDHEAQGTHVEIGMRVLRKHGIDEAVIDAMKSHHEEYPFETPESIAVQVADAISGGRPGARSDTAGMYIKKLEGLERIAEAIPGVTSAYAISAGREIRIFVDPEKIDDAKAHAIAKNIADQVEKELQYPGEIKVHVIRETHSVTYAR